MGEEVTQYDLVNSNTGSCSTNSNNNNNNVKGNSIDEVDKAMPSSLQQQNECAIEIKCVDKSAKKSLSPSHDGEKSKKWYNLSFMNRANTTTHTNVASVSPIAGVISRSNNSSEHKNSENMKMDKRHSWHLNDSAVVEM